jgi:hypothetical protein
MSHMNITLRERHSNESQLSDRVAILEAEKKLLEQKLEAAESNLRSVFERIRAGEPVYLQYGDGERIHIAAADPPG